MYKRGRNLATIIFLLFFIFFYAKSSVFAQMLGGNLVEQQISFVFAPENPGPRTEVTVNITSSDIDLNSSKITWSLNNKVVSDGTGKTNFNFTTGALGESVSLNVNIRPLNPNLNSIQKNFIFRPADVDLIYQADSLVPPFYKGKALYTQQGELLLVAIPHIYDSQKKEIDSSNLIYNWKSNGVAVPEVSGYGKNVFPFLSPVVSDNKTISVIVSDINNNSSAEKSIRLSPTKPIISIYENHPLYGARYNRDIGDVFDLGEKEVAFIAIPYFFSSNKQSLSNLKFNWSVNGTAVNQEAQKNNIVLRNETGAKGLSKISVSIKNLDKFLQFANRDFSVKFEK